MNDVFTIAIVLTAVGAMLSLMFLVLSRENKKIRAGLTYHKKIAEMADTKHKLIGIRLSLVDWTRDNCWHPSQVAAAREVLAYIDGKLASHG